MTNQDLTQRLTGPRGWTWWAAAGGIPWLSANFVALFFWDDLDDDAQISLGIGGLALTVGLVSATFLGRISSTANASWMLAGLGGLVDGASFGPALAFQGWEPWLAVPLGAALTVFAAGAVGGFQYAWINQGWRDRARERARSRRAHKLTG